MRKKYLGKERKRIDGRKGNGGKKLIIWWIRIENEVIEKKKKKENIKCYG